MKATREKCLLTLFTGVSHVDNFNDFIEFCQEELNDKFLNTFGLIIVRPQLMKKLQNEYEVLSK